MSARGDLMAALTDPGRPTRHSEAVQLIDAYARELAEKVRGHLLPDDEQPHVPWNRAVRNLAELIDPEAS